MSGSGGSYFEVTNTGAYIKGNVGIGMTTPGSKLQVAGDIALSA